MKYFFLILMICVCGQEISASGLHIPDNISTHKKMYIKKKNKIVSDVTEESWSPDKPVASITTKSRLQPTKQTIAEHDNMLNMLRNIGFKITEDSNLLTFNLPSNYTINRYNKKNIDIPDATGFMRAMSLSNEVVDRHFLMFPNDEKLHVELKTNHGNDLLSYDIKKSEWEKAEGEIGLTTQTLNGKDSSGILQSLKVSSIVRSIR